jgi:hypothetical protein
MPLNSMFKKPLTQQQLQAELDRRVRERARGPYSLYQSSAVPQPVALPGRDAAGCNWTVISPTNQTPSALPFFDLIITQLMREYDLIQG